MSKIKIQSIISQTKNQIQARFKNQTSSVRGPIGHLSDGTPKYRFKDGIRKIIELTQSINERPVFIAVWGHAHAGKTHLAYNLTNEFEKFGLLSTGCATINGSLRITAEMDFCLLQCSGYRDLSLDSHRGDKPYYFGTNYIYLVKQAGKQVHINVFIYNPRFHRKISGKYDLVIENPDSTIKKLPK
ncbi:MAG: hypothetical protein V3T21_00020 [Candidatus Margulisiibacteriota bacterium]